MHYIQLVCAELSRCIHVSNLIKKYIHQEKQFNMCHIFLIRGIMNMKILIKFIEY